MATITNYSKKSLLFEIAGASETKGTVFKTWCIQNAISQTQIRDQTALSIGCIHHLWNDGRASKSTIKLLSLVYHITESYIQNMIITFDVDAEKTRKIINNIKKL